MSFDNYRLSLRDHGAQFGALAFEGYRLIDGKLLLAKEHHQRLCRSAAYLGIEMLPHERYQQYLRGTISASGLQNGYVRVNLTSGNGGLGIEHHLCKEPVLAIEVNELKLFSNKLYQEGLTLHVAATRKIPYSCLNCSDVKHGNYLNNIRAQNEAHRVGADEALMLTIDGYVSEASVENIFAIYGNTVLTPHPDSNCLKGVTRSAIIGITQELGFKLQEKLFTLEELLHAEEIFLTGTGAGIVPIRAIDNHTFARNGNTVKTDKIREAYERLLPELCSAV